MLKFALLFVFLHFDVQNVKGLSHLSIFTKEPGQLELMYMREFKDQIFATNKQEIPNEICRSEFNVEKLTEFMTEILTKNPTELEKQKHARKFPRKWLSGKIKQETYKYTRQLEEMSTDIFWSDRERPPSIASERKIADASAFCSSVELVLNYFHPKYKIITEQQVLMVKSPLKKYPSTERWLMMMICEGGYFLLAPANVRLKNAGEKEAVIHAYLHTETEAFYQTFNKIAPVKIGPSFEGPANSESRNLLKQIENDVRETLNTLPTNKEFIDCNKVHGDDWRIYWNRLRLVYMELDIKDLEKELKEWEKQINQSIREEIERTYGSDVASSSEKK